MDMSRWGRDVSANERGKMYLDSSLPADSRNRSDRDFVHARARYVDPREYPTGILRRPLDSHDGLPGHEALVLPDERWRHGEYSVDVVRR
jgi:hypothetical protein